MHWQCLTIRWCCCPQVMDSCCSFKNGHLRSCEKQFYWSQWGNRNYWLDSEWNNNSYCTTKKYLRYSKKMCQKMVPIWYVWTTCSDLTEPHLCASQLSRITDLSHHLVQSNEFVKWMHRGVGRDIKTHTHTQREGLCNHTRLWLRGFICIHTGRHTHTRKE